MASKWRTQFAWAKPLRPWPLRRRLSVGGRHSRRASVRDGEEDRVRGPQAVGDRYRAGLGVVGDHDADLVLAPGPDRGIDSVERDAAAEPAKVTSGDRDQDVGMAGAGADA